MKIKDWIPRSRSPYIVLSAVTGTGYYLYWDRHQSSLIQSLYEREAEVLGRQTIFQDAPLRKITVLLSGRDGFECAERRRLFRNHTAKLMLKAGIDWQVLEVNESALAKRLNKVHLDDAERKEMTTFDRSVLLESMACKWAFPAHKPQEDDVNTLLEIVAVQPVSKPCPTDEFVVLDSTSMKAVQSGFRQGRELRQGSLAAFKEKDSFSWLAHRILRRKPSSEQKPEFIEPRIHLIDIPIYASMAARLFSVLDTRRTTLTICQQTMKFIAETNN